MPEIINPQAARRMVIAQGDTSGSGTFPVTFSPPFESVPHVSAEMMPAPNTETFIRISAVSASGCTAHCFSRQSLTVLGINLLSSAVANANGVRVSIMAMEQ